MSFRRRITLGLLAIAFGVVATYATAWAAVWWGPIGKVSKQGASVTWEGWSDDPLLWWPEGVSFPLTRPTRAESHEAIGWRLWEGHNIGDSIYVIEGRPELVDTAKSNGLVPVVATFAGWEVLDSTRGFASAMEMRAGWPFRCLRWTGHRWHGSDLSFRNEAVNGALGAPRHARPMMSATTTPGWLPVRPVWPQFLANVAIWAVFVSLVGVAFNWLVRNRRSSRRLRRGLCVRCGYDLVGLDPRGGCPECGGPVSASAADECIAAPHVQSPSTSLAGDGAGVEGVMAPGVAGPKTIEPESASGARTP